MFMSVPKVTSNHSYFYIKAGSYVKLVLWSCLLYKQLHMGAIQKKQGPILNTLLCGHRNTSLTISMFTMYYFSIT